MYSSRLHVVMYSLLLLATPFLLVRNYLQNAIGAITHFTFNLWGKDIPTVPAIALIFVILFLVYFRSYLTKLRILAGTIVLVMIALAQQISDMYAGFDFYDLQQNWHYFAYAIFAFMIYRDLVPRRIPMAKIMLIIYGCALLFSSFDEIFQRHMSLRVFDISDIAKDVCGALLGMILIFLGGNEAKKLLSKWKQIHHRKLKDYFQNPLSILILLTVFTFIFLSVSSLLTEFKYWALAAFITIIGSLIVFLLFHFSQYNWGKYGLLTVFAIVLIGQSFFFMKYRKDNIIYNRPGLTVYKGIPILFFDVMIYPDGRFRLVDKKESFNLVDRRFFMEQEVDIIVIGSGIDGRGGQGFPKYAPYQFVYNRFIGRGTQVIILKSPEASKLYNRLKQEQKNVLFILHNA